LPLAAGASAGSCDNRVTRAVDSAADNDFGFQISYFRPCPSASNLSHNPRAGESAPAGRDWPGALQV